MYFLSFFLKLSFINSHQYSYMHIWQAKLYDFMPIDAVWMKICETISKLSVQIFKWKWNNVDRATATTPPAALEGIRGMIMTPGFQYRVFRKNCIFSQFTATPPSSISLDETFKALNAMRVYSHSYWQVIFCTTNSSRSLARERWQTSWNSLKKHNI